MLRTGPDIPLALKDTRKWTESISPVRCRVPVKDDTQRPRREPPGSTCASPLTDHETSKTLSVCF